MEESIYKNAKILVVDDIEEVLNSTRNSLKFEGMNVETSNNPIEALEYLKTNKVDVVLLDFFMPQMNGDKFIEKLREFNNETVIILRTGYSDKVPPMEMLDSLNIQGYIDKLKGEDELLLMTKSAIKTSYLYKQIIEKDKEIAKLHYKNSIKGNLIVNLVNEAKDQLMQISGMNQSIKMNSKEYERETNIIKNALEKTYELYEALNFENLKNIDLLKFNKIVKILIKPTLLLNNANLLLETEDNSIIVHNSSDNIYLTIKLIEILIENNNKEIKVKAIKENNSEYLQIITENIINNINLQEIELITSGKELKIDNNIIKFKI